MAAVTPGGVTISGSPQAGIQFAASDPSPSNTLAPAVTRTHFDLDGRVDETTATDGVRSRTSYDLAGRMVAQADAVTTANPAGNVTSYGYDGLGRVVSVAPPVGAATTSLYGWAVYAAGSLVHGPTVSSSPGQNGSVVMTSDLAGRLDVVRAPGRSAARPSLLPAFPAAVGALVICATQIGLLGTALVAVVTVLVIVGGLRLYVARVARVNSRRAVRGEESIRVDGSWNGKAGKAQVSRAGVDFAATHGGQSAAMADEIQRIELSPVRAIIRATRARLFMTDGSEIRVTFTAPIDTIARALGT